MKLLEIKAVLRAFEYMMTKDQLLTFVEVATNPGIRIVDLAFNLGFPQSTASRNTDLLSTFGRGGRKGLGLITKVPLPSDRRVHTLYLTAKGKLMSTKLKRI